ncbi:hypothetical protein FA95DRAFT_1562450 [Auriscalpium vulgare]|uniref:Uncharacterized protein n=1 Tax=Auriscalpium vulgare TaxID=40419 RepID=A0ACB8RKL0_9AGAM|nr:hypothetical protein FA95DRAFT_1562450 [Auriscalpium vulgare]
MSLEARQPRPAQVQTIVQEFRIPTSPPSAHACAKPDPAASSVLVAKSRKFSYVRYVRLEATSHAAWSAARRRRARCHSSLLGVAMLLLRARSRHALRSTARLRDVSLVLGSTPRVRVLEFWSSGWRRAASIATGLLLHGSSLLRPFRPSVAFSHRYSYSLPFNDPVNLLHGRVHALITQRPRNARCVRRLCSTPRDSRLPVAPAK